MLTVLSKELANVLNIENRYEVDYEEVLKRVKWYLYKNYVCDDLICNKCDCPHFPIEDDE